MSDQFAHYLDNPYIEKKIQREPRFELLAKWRESGDVFDDNQGDDDDGTVQL